MKRTRRCLCFFPAVASMVQGRLPICQGELGPAAPAGICVKLLATLNGRILIQSNKYGFVWADPSDLQPEIITHE